MRSSLRAQEPARQHGQERRPRPEEGDQPDDQGRAGFVVQAGLERGQALLHAREPCVHLVEDAAHACLLACNLLYQIVVVFKQALHTGQLRGLLGHERPSSSRVTRLLTRCMAPAKPRDASAWIAATSRAVVASICAVCASTAFCCVNVVMITCRNTSCCARWASCCVRWASIRSKSWVRVTSSITDSPLQTGPWSAPVCRGGPVSAGWRPVARRAPAPAGRHGGPGVGASLGLAPMPGSPR